jgi:hypothetical protein
MARVLFVAVLALASGFQTWTSGGLGPPLVCREIEIGAERSLPWKGGPFGRDPAFPSEKIVGAAIEVLEGSDDAVVHMETLRRSYIYLEFGSDRSALAGLGDLLAKRVVDVATSKAGEPPARLRRQAMAWFDLGYLMAICANSGPALLPSSSFGKILGHVAAMASQSADLRFGVGYALLGNFGSGWGPHLAAATTLATDPGSLVAKALDGVKKDFAISESRTDFASASRPARASSRPESRASLTVVGTVDDVCSKVLIIEVDQPAAGEQPGRAVVLGTMLDVISSDRQTYVGRIEVVGNWDGGISAVLTVGVPKRAVATGDLAVAGLN